VSTSNDNTQLAPAAKVASVIERDALPGLHAVRAPGRDRSQRTRLFMAHLRAAVGAPAWLDQMPAPAKQGSDQAVTCPA